MVLAHTDKLAGVSRSDGVLDARPRENTRQPVPGTFAMEWPEIGPPTAMQASSFGHPTPWQLNKLGNYHCNNRVYSIGHGRWLSPDQAKSSLFSLLGYAGNRATTVVDPTGLEEKSWQEQLDWEKDLMSENKLTELFREKCGSTNNCCTYDCCMRGARQLATHIVAAIKAARDKLEDKSYGWEGNTKNTYRKKLGKKVQCNECADWREIVQAAVSNFKPEPGCDTCATPENRRGHSQQTFWSYDWTSNEWKEYIAWQHNWAIVKFCGSEVNVDPWANGWADGSEKGTDINDSSALIHKKEREEYEKSGGYKINKWGDLERSGRRGF